MESIDRGHGSPGTGSEPRTPRGCSTVGCQCYARYGTGRHLVPCSLEAKQGSAAVCLKVPAVTSLGPWETGPGRGSAHLELAAPGARPACTRPVSQTKALLRGVSNGDPGSGPSPPRSLCLGRQA